MPLININNSNDPNFRYKINKIEITHTGSGTQKGFLTKLDNIQLISNQINHNPTTILKYLGICLGSKVNEELFWIQGTHSQDKIQEYIFDFIKTFVLCSKCSVPELEYTSEKIKKYNIIKTHCMGCGFDNNIDSDVLSKYNKKIYDKIINDIESSFFNKETHTTNLDKQDDFILEEDQDFF
jgi:translation initiation factor 5